MRRRMPAVFLAALLTFAVSACGDDSGDSGEPSETGTTTSQTDDATADDSTTEPDDTDDSTTEPDDDGSDDDKGDGKDDRDDSGKDDRDDSGKDDDENGAIPDDLESEGPDDPDDLPIDAEVVLSTCEDVDPKDTWPSANEVTFDGGESNVVATADVTVKGGQTRKIVCDIAGPENSPQVMAYQPIS